MNGINTPEVGKVLAENGLKYIRKPTVI